MVVNRQRRVPVAIDSLKLFAERARRELRFADGAVTVCLVSDAAIARLNRRYRGRPGPTDVLSFPSTARRSRTSPMGRLIKDFQEGTAEPVPTWSGAVPNIAIRKGASAPEAIRTHAGSITEPRSAYAGDIAISPSAARRNARRLARTLPDELRVLILHGMLHLAGYDHETDRGEMDRIERRLRRRLGLG